MKQNTKWIVIITAIMILICTLPFLSHAQDGPFDQPQTTQTPAPGAPDPGPCPTCPAGGPVPIDGGLSLLLAAGVGYGIKKVRDSRKKAQHVENF